MARPTLSLPSIMAASTARSACSACGGVRPGMPVARVSVPNSVMVVRFLRGCVVRRTESVRKVFLREPLQILPDRTLGGGVPQAIRGMVGHDHLGAAPAEGFPAERAKAQFRLQQEL